MTLLQQLEITAKSHFVKSHTLESPTQNIFNQEKSFSGDELHPENRMNRFLGKRDEGSARIIIVLLVAVGTLLRARQYFFNRSLWLDESLLTLNILHRTAHQLFHPLMNHQGAPLGFLLAEKLIVSIFGSSEYALRALPFAGGVASVFLIYKVASRFLSGIGIPIAVGLFAVSQRAIYYSSEVKQYSTDVTVILLLYLLGFRLFKTKLSTVDLVFASLGGSVAIWFSHPAVFVLAAIAACALWFQLKVPAQRETAIRILLIGSVWFLNFVVFSLISLRGLVNDQGLMDYWKEGFPPSPLLQPGSIHWVVSSVLNLAYDPLQINFAGVALFAVVIGAAGLFYRDRLRAVLLLLPLAFVLFAAVLHRYPFRGRLLLFLVPILLLLISSGAEALFDAVRASFPLAGIWLIVLLVLPPFLEARRQFVRPIVVEEIRPVLEYYKSRRAPGDVVYVYYSAQYQYEYYAERERLGAHPLVIGIESRLDRQKYLTDLETFRGNRRVWIVFSHTQYLPDIDDEPLFLQDLDTLGRKVESFSAPGAAIFLYDLSTS